MTRGEGGWLLLPSAGLSPAILRQFAWRTTATCVSTSMRRRVRDSVEWFGVASVSAVLARATGPWTVRSSLGSSQLALAIRTIEGPEHDPAGRSQEASQ